MVFGHWWAMDVCHCLGYWLQVVTGMVREETKQRRLKDFFLSFLLSSFFVSCLSVYLSLFLSLYSILSFLSTVGGERVGKEK